jgi:hypothetical protein
VRKHLSRQLGLVGGVCFSHPIVMQFVRVMEAVLTGQQAPQLRSAM